jgi:outer membrane receptor for ferric coprogen and ferric-rhodotorulic acid
MRIEVIRESEDRLSDERWVFDVQSPMGASDTLVMRLAAYQRRERATTRHKMQIKDYGRAQWDLGDMRTYHSGIDRKDVPLPDDLIAEAKAKIKVEFKP